jgi:uncharacterized protein YbbC (DUF1343 family)
VKLSELDSVLQKFDYPLSKSDAIDRTDDVVVLYADGDEPLPDVIERIDADSFDSAQDFQTQAYNVLPTEAVGEPGQSEGEG